MFFLFIAPEENDFEVYIGNENVDDEHYFYKLNPGDSVEFDSMYEPFHLWGFTFLSTDKVFMAAEKYRGGSIKRGFLRRKGREVDDDYVFTEAKLLPNTELVEDKQDYF